MPVVFMIARIGGPLLSSFQSLYQPTYLPEAIFHLITEKLQNILAKNSPYKFTEIPPLNLNSLAFFDLKLCAPKISS